MKVVVVIQADPGSSPLPAEGLRVGLGLATGPLDVEVVLRGEGVRCLAREPWDLVRGEELESNRVRLAGAGVAIHVERDPTRPAELDLSLAADLLDEAAAAERLAAADRILVFA